MLEEGDMDPNGKLFDEKLEWGNGCLGERKFVIVKRYGMSYRDEGGI